ncbi:hypothetical protein Tco_0675527 [Tanacetum coccineum]
MESSVQFICVFCGSLSDEYGCPCSTCKLCGNEAHYGYDCPSQVPFVYNQDPCFNQNLDNFPQTSPSFPQQYLCCEDCGGPHATFQCQPMNQSFYNSNSSGFDQIQPPQYSVVHQSPQETDMEMLQAREDLMEAIQVFLKKYDHIPPKEKCMALLLAEERFLKVKQAFEEEQNQPEIIQELLLQLIHDFIAELLAEEQAATINSLYQNPDLQQSFIYHDDDNDDDDYDKESILSMNTDMFKTPSPDAITTSSPIEELKDSLIMEDEDINTIPEKESDKENESSVENLFYFPTESKVTSDNESECDLPIFDDSPLNVFEDNCVLFSKPLFDSYGDSTSSEYSSDNESFLEEDVFSNLSFEFDIESISSDVTPIYNEVLEDIDGTNYLIDSIIDFSNKIDPLLEEFAGELSLINPIPPGIARVDSDPKGDIRLVEKFTTTHFDISLPKYDSFHFDLSDTSLHLADKSDSVFEKIYDELAHIILPPEVHIPNVLPTLPTLYLDLDFTFSYDSFGLNLVASFPFGNRNKTFDPGISIEVQSKRFLSLNTFSISFISDPLSPVLETLLPFSSDIEDKVFNPRILVKEEKSPHLLSHQGFKVFKIIHNFLNESPMMIYGGDMPILDVPYLHFYPP